MNTRQQFCTFTLGGLHLGIAVERVQEVIRSQPMTRVPLAPGAVRGLINLRGQIVTAFDLRERFGLPARTSDAPPINVVVRTDDGPTSFLVDDIGDVTEASEEAFESPPDTVTGPIRDCILGVYKLRDSLLLSLDTEKAVRFT